MLIVIGAAFAIVGLLFLALAVRQAHKTRRLLADGLRAFGTVCELRRSRTEGGNRSAAPVFEFEAADGQLHRVTSPLSSYPPRHRIGQGLDVVYPRDDPSAAVIDSFMELWLEPLLLAIGGGVALLIGLAITLLPAA